MLTTAGVLALLPAPVRPLREGRPSGCLSIGFFSTSATTEKHSDGAFFLQKENASEAYTAQFTAATGQQV